MMARPTKAASAQSAPCQRSGSMRSGRCREPGQDRIGEVGQDRGRDIDRLDGLEQAIDEAGEHDADAPSRSSARADRRRASCRSAARSRRRRGRSRCETTASAERRPPSPSTIFDSTSETPSARPAAMPGASGSRTCSEGVRGGLGRFRWRGMLFRSLSLFAVGDPALADRRISYGSACRRRAR